MTAGGPSSARLLLRALTVALLAAVVGCSAAGQYRTTDAGRRWQLGDLPSSAAGDGAASVSHVAASHVAFTGAAGYVFATHAWATGDGGQRWRPSPGPTTESLVTDGATSYRLVYQHSGCPGPCNPLLQTARTGSDHWRTLRRVRSGFGASVTAAGSLVLVTVSGHPGGGAPEAHTEYLISIDGGEHWRVRTDPCGGQGRREWDTGPVAVTPREIGAICVKRGLPQHPPTIVVSHDGGRTFSARRRISLRPFDGMTFAGRRLLFASDAASGAHHVTYRIAMSRDGGRRWRVVGRDRSVANNAGRHWTQRISCAGRGCAFLANSRHLLVSTDRGRTWTRRTPPG